MSPDYIMLSFCVLVDIHLFNHDNDRDNDNGVLLTELALAWNKSTTLGWVIMCTNTIMIYVNIIIRGI